MSRLGLLLVLVSAACAAPSGRSADRGQKFDSSGGTPARVVLVELDQATMDWSAATLSAFDQQPIGSLTQDFERFRETLATLQSRINQAGPAAVIWPFTFSEQTGPATQALADALAASVAPVTIGTAPDVVNDPRIVQGRLLGHTVVIDADADGNPVLGFPLEAAAGLQLAASDPLSLAGAIGYLMSSGYPFEQARSELWSAMGCLEETVLAAQGTGTQARYLPLDLETRVDPTRLSAANILAAPTPDLTLAGAIVVISPSWSGYGDIARWDPFKSGQTLPGAMAYAWSAAELTRAHDAWTARGACR